VTAERFPRVASLKTAVALRTHLAAAGIPLEFDETLVPPAASPLAQPFEVDGRRVGNRFCALPMEGWDGTADGKPSDLTVRRWRNFGASGAKLIWGGEAVAVCHEGRANPNQLVLNECTQASLAALRHALVDEHEAVFGRGAADDLFVGLQLTHSGRFARPNGQSRSEPLAAYAHPYLDRRFAGTVPVLSDDDLDRIGDRFVHAARLARDVGFQFVDVKHCHGYLLHELLSARVRPGRYGGSFENRTRFLRDVVARIRADLPGLEIGVRLSVFDSVPFRKGPTGRGEPEAPSADYPYAFGLLQDEALHAALDDARAVLRMLREMAIRWVCTTAGSPYYCPHLQRPAAFPPSDGYEPPEDPLRGVARQIEATAILKKEVPDLVFVGSGYTYLQEWLPHVAQFNVRTARTDFVGLGRLMLSYPRLPADLLAGRPLNRKALCRTFSDCTTGPRLGLVSGCYPLDPFYESHPDAARLRAFKTEARA
jgi:2,4-dienoyl-CoA reductase-like NADH-dependent reductase (Old Yellow Enzyme family)